MKRDWDTVLDSLMIFDRPEKERLRNFLPPAADVDALVDDLFAGVERGGRS